MNRYDMAPPFKHDDTPAVGVLLANLGTPDEPTAPALKRYLAQFLTDHRVVDLPRALWLPILYGIILNTRPKKSAELYERIWTDEGSPLLTIGMQQRDAVAKALQEGTQTPVHVALGMRYGNPSIADALNELRAKNVQRIVVLPLYPQYAGATTASSFDAVAQALDRWRWVPSLRFINSYHDHPGYIRALANSIREHWQKTPRGERLLFSFHGIPKRYFDEGDPYHCTCQKTARLVAEDLGLEKDEYFVAFQSRFGREPWLKPYTDETLMEWAEAGVRRVDAVCPGFSADCVETLEEIALTNREDFVDAGGEALEYVPALNDRPDHIEALVDILRNELGDWLQTASDASASAEIAREMGAAA